jgi:hypothetical protein
LSRARGSTRRPALLKLPPEHDAGIEPNFIRVAGSAANGACQRAGDGTFGERDDLSELRAARG